jgi:hypothetical protein
MIGGNKEVEKFAPPFVVLHPQPGQGELAAGVIWYEPEEVERDIAIQMHRAWIVEELDTDRRAIPVCDHCDILSCTTCMLVTSAEAFSTFAVPLRMLSCF